MLASPDSRGSFYQDCIETGGWVGFQDPNSNRFLGHDISGRLCCEAKRHELWECFHARARPEGGYVLLMTHWFWLRYVGIKVEEGFEKLVKIGDKEGDAIVWEFVKV